MKKAYVVEFNLRTRVVVDDDKILTQETLEDVIIASAHQKVINNISSKLLDSDLEINEDLETPCDPKTGKEK